MAINSLHVNKTLRFLDLSKNRFLDSSDRGLRKELLTDISRDRRKSAGRKTGGGNFYGPFWGDVRRHFLREGNISELTKDTIGRDHGRENLYTLLEANFQIFLRRGHNSEAELSAKRPNGDFNLSDIGLTTKVEGILTLIIEGDEHLVYPYWFNEPRLSDDTVRIGLWLISKALPYENPENIRILDIMRANYFSLETHPLKGNEEELLIQGYQEISNFRQELAEEKEEREKRKNRKSR